MRIADVMEANLERLATAETWDNGKPIREARAADIPLAIDHGVRTGRIRRGHRLLLEGVGGGFTWGAALVDY